MASYMNQWTHRPYCRHDDIKKKNSPFICRIAPMACGFEFEWLDNKAPNAPHSVKITYHKSEDTTELVYPLDGNVCKIEGLQDNTDYDFVVFETGTDRCSYPRVIRTGAFPATVVHYYHPDDTTYEFSGTSIITPSIVTLPSGRMLVGVDVCESRLDFPADAQCTILCCSDDDGKTWRYLSDIVPSIWIKPFMHRGQLYVLACSSEYGSLVISKSDDEGETWDCPTTLFYGEGRHGKGWILNGLPPVEIDGRLYFAAEYGTEVWLPHEPTPEQRSQYRTPFWVWRDKHVTTDFVMASFSCDADADIMKPENWHMSELYQQDLKYGWTIEGSIVKAPDGSIKEIIRTGGVTGLSVTLDKDNPEGPMTFDSNMENFPFFCVRFMIRQDPITKKYICIGNEVGGVDDIWDRTVIAMGVSDDLYHWKVVKRVLDCRKMDASFAYAAWDYKGDDIVIAVRSCWNGGINWHDTNSTLFARIENYRQYLD